MVSNFECLRGRFSLFGFRVNTLYVFWVCLCFRLVILCGSSWMVCFLYLRFAVFFQCAVARNSRGSWHFLDIVCDMSRSMFLPYHFSSLLLPNYCFILYLPEFSLWTFSNINKPTPFTSELCLIQHWGFKKLEGRIWCFRHGYRWNLSQGCTIVGTRRRPHFSINLWEDWHFP